MKSAKIENCCFLYCTGVTHGIICSLFAKTAEINNCYAIENSHHDGALGSNAFRVESDQFSSLYLNNSYSTMKRMSGLLVYKTELATVKFHTNVQHISDCITYCFGNSVDMNCYADYSYHIYHNITLSDISDNVWRLTLYRLCNLLVRNCAISNIQIGSRQTIFRNGNGYLTVENCAIDIPNIPKSGSVISENLQITSNVITYSYSRTGK